MKGSRPSPGDKPALLRAGNSSCSHPPSPILACLAACALFAPTLAAQTQLYTLTGDGPDDGYGADVAGGRDLNGDGLDDLIVGREQEFAEAKPGAVRTYTTCVGTSQNYGSGLAGSGGFVPEISFAGCAELGGSVTLTIDKALGGAPGILFVGLAPAALPAKGGSLLVQILFAINHQAAGPVGVPGAGSVSFPATLPNDPALIGQTISQQAWYGDGAAPANISMTDGLAYTVVGF